MPGAARFHIISITGGDEIYDVAFKKYSISGVYKFNNNNMFSMAFAPSNFPLPKNKKSEQESGKWAS